MNNVRSSLCVVILAYKVHRFAKLVDIDERTDENDREKHAEYPEIGSAEGIRQTAAHKLVPYAFGQLVEPYQGSDPERKRTDEEKHKAGVHGLFAVVTCGDGVDRIRNIRERHE